MNIPQPIFSQIAIVTGVLALSFVVTSVVLPAKNPPKQFVDRIPQSETRVKLFTDRVPETVVEYRTVFKFIPQPVVKTDPLPQKPKSAKKVSRKKKSAATKTEKCRFWYFNKSKKRKMYRLRDC